MALRRKSEVDKSVVFFFFCTEEVNASSSPCQPYCTNTDLTRSMPETKRRRPQYYFTPALFLLRHVQMSSVCSAGARRPTFIMGVSGTESGVCASDRVKDVCLRVPVCWLHIKDASVVALASILFNSCLRAGCQLTSLQSPVELLVG